MTAIVFLCLLIGHLLGDWIVQTDAQAMHKTTSWRAMGGHVLGYHLTLGVVLLIPVVRGWPAGAAAVSLVVSGVTHAFIDRRWPVRWLLRHTGSPGFAEQMWGVIAVDQALHLTILALLAVLLT